MPSRVELLPSSRTRIRVSVCSLLVLCAARAVAAPQVEIPEECGSVASFEAEVRARVGAHADAILRDAMVRIDRDGTEFRLYMRVGTEVRAFHDASCAELLRAAVVVAVSLAEGPTAERESSAAPPAKMPEETQVPRARTDEPAAPPEKDAGSRDRSRPRIGIGAGVGTNFGFLPHPSVAAELIGSALWEPWGVAVRGRYFAPATEQDVEGRGVEVQAAGAEVAAFWFGWHFLEVRAGMNVRAAFGSGIGSPATSNDTAWSFGPIAGVSATPFIWGNTWVGLGADVALDLARPHFEILRYHEVFRSSLVDGSLFLGAGHLFR
jgi:hypothetical protein